MPDLDIVALRKTYRYQKFRNRFMRRNRLCAECDRQGRVTVSEEMDHIVPVHEAPDRVWDIDNLQALCRECHERKTANENRRPDPERDGWEALIQRLSSPA